MDLIEWMQDFCANEEDYSNRLLSFADKWSNRLKQQSSLVSYHTTKRSQLDCVRVTRDIAKLKQSSCTQIKSVIEKYRQQINEVFVNERFRPVRRHQRTNELKKSFKLAQASVRELDDELKLLRNQLEKAREIVRSAESACEILDLDPTTTDKQRQRSKDILERKKSKVADIKDRIDQLKERQSSVENTYQIKATEIFQECQHVEEERLEQIRETLLDFIQAAHPSDSSSKLQEIFDKLNQKVTNEQNSFDDIVFWAKTYGVDDKLTRLLISKNDSDENSDEILSSRIRLRRKKKTNEQYVNDQVNEKMVNKPKSRRTRPNSMNEKRNSNHCDSLLNQM